MQNENKLLRAVADSREAYSKIAPNLEETDLSEVSNVIFEKIGDYYELDPEANHVDYEILEGNILGSMKSDKHRQMFTRLLNDLQDTEASAPNVTSYFLRLRADALGRQIATSLLSGGEVSSDVLDLMDKYKNISDAVLSGTDQSDQKIYRGLSAAELTSTVYKPENAIQLLPKALNDSLEGSAIPGHNVLVYGRPEMGKTALLINMIFGFLKQGLPVLYCGNEDPIEHIAMRVLSRLSGMPKHEIMQNSDRADERARERNYDNLTLAQLSPGTVREVAALVEEYHPTVVVVDQLRNLQTREENYVRQLEIAAQGMRKIASRYSVLCVSTTQAGDSAEGKAVLDLGDVDFSNTGIPGAMDLMIGIGASEEDKKFGRRVLSLPKNKISGDHTPVRASIDETLSKLTSGG